MKNSPNHLRTLAVTAATATALCLLAVHSASANNGAASFLDWDGTIPGFGTPADTTETALTSNNIAVTFTGPGTYNFPTPFGCNSTAANTQNMTGVINLQMSPVTSASTYSGGYFLSNGILNFASAGSANAFNGFAAGKTFSING